MEFFFGSFITLAIGVIIFNKLNSKDEKLFKKKLVIRQSRINDLILAAKYPNYFAPPKRKQTQSEKFMEKNTTTVVIYENQAYWIADNSLLVANVIDGSVDINSTKRVDTMVVDPVELNKLSIIVDKLTKERTNDSGNSGNEELF